MIAEFINLITTFLYAVFNQLGWMGVAGLMAFESATGITSSEFILSVAGWILISLDGASPVMIFSGGLYAALGSVVGSSVTYWFTRLGGRPALNKAIRWVRIKPHLLEQAEALFKRWGPAIIFFGRLIPGIRILVTIPAGLVRMNFFQFLFYTFWGTLVWCTSFIGLGYFVGHKWDVISLWFVQFTPWVLISVLAVLGLWIISRSLIQSWLRFQIERTRGQNERISKIMSNKSNSHRLGRPFALPPKWRWILYPVIVTGGGGTTLAFFMEGETLTWGECASIAVIPGLAAVLYWFNHYVFKSAITHMENAKKSFARCISLDKKD